MTSAATPPRRTVPAATRQDPSAPEPHETQRQSLEALRHRAGVRTVKVRSVTLVTDSVQVLVEVTERGRRTYRAVIAPSGRIHPI